MNRRNFLRGLAISVAAVCLQFRPESAAVARVAPAKKPEIVAAFTMSILLECENGDLQQWSPGTPIPPNTGRIFIRKDSETLPLNKLRIAA